MSSVSKSSFFPNKHFKYFSSFSSESWAKSPRIRQSGNQLFLSLDSKYTLREAITSLFFAYPRTCARFILLSIVFRHAMNPTAKGILAIYPPISSKHNHVILYTQLSGANQAQSWTSLEDRTSNAMSSGASCCLR